MKTNDELNRWQIPLSKSNCSDNDNAELINTKLKIVSAIGAMHIHTIKVAQLHVVNVNYDHNLLKIFHKIVSNLLKYAMDIQM